MAFTWASSATSQGIANALCPCACSASAAERTDVSFQSARTTEAPDSAKAFTVARPSPDPAPVTSATLPSNKISRFPAVLLLIRPPVLLIAHFLHPVHDFAVERFLNGDMCHRRVRLGAMPMLLPGRGPDHVAGADLPDRAAPALDQPAT